MDIILERTVKGGMTFNLGCGGSCFTTSWKAVMPSNLNSSLRSHDSFLDSRFSLLPLLYFFTLLDPHLIALISFPLVILPLGIFS